MYARRYGAEDGKDPVSLPINYSGSAFFEKEEQETKERPTEPRKTEETCSCSPDEPRCDEESDGTLLSLLSGKLLSADALLILLAFLLMGNGEKDDLPSILIFLLLI